MKEKMLHLQKVKAYSKYLQGMLVNCYIAASSFMLFNFGTGEADDFLSVSVH